jgi:hypothetical protein
MGALVGVDGEMEHGGACVHPMLGKPTRAAIGGGKAVISSNVASAVASLDVPLGHKDDSWSFPHVDTVTVSVTDAFAGVSATDSRQPQAEVYRFQNSCDGMRNARLKREDAFSHTMIIVSSAMVSSS